MNQTRKNKKSTMRKKFLVSLIAILTLMLGCAGCKKTPEEALDKAIEKTFTDTDPAEKLLGLEAINKAIANNDAYTSGVSITLENLSGADLEEYADILSGIGFSVDTASDIKNEKTEGTVGITYGGTTYFTAASQLNDSKFYFMLPQLLNGSLSLDFATLGKDLSSDSLVGQAIAASGLAVPEDLSFDIWDFITSFETTEVEVPEELTKAYEAFDKEIIIEEVKLDDADIPSGVDAKKAYTMTIPEDAYKDYISECTQYVLETLNDALTDESLQDIVTDVDMPSQAEIDSMLDVVADVLDDIVITFAVTKDGYVSYMGSKLDIEVLTLEFNATFDGDKSPLEEIEIEFSATVDDETVSVEFAQSFDSEEKTVSYEGKLSAIDFTATIEAEGEYSDIEKGKKYAFDLNYFEFDCSEDYGFTFSGSSYIDTTSCDIKTPGGTEYELLKMDESDMENLATEVMTNLQNDPLFSEIFELLGAEFE